MKAVTLLYHDVILPGAYQASGFQSPDANIYKLDREEFADHLTALATRAGQQIDVVSTGTPLTIPPILLTFDDGGASAYSFVADMLEARGWHGHFLVTTDYISRPGFLSPPEIRALNERGHIIGSHSCSHPVRMARCSQTELDQEWQKSVAVLSDILGEPVDVASVPGGYFSPEVARAAARAGIRILFNSEPVVSSQTIDGCVTLGRFCVRHGVSAEWAAAVASGAVWPRLESYLFWNAKKAAKRVGGEYWLEFRKKLLAKRAPSRPERAKDSTEA
jgi:peptidoglycan/xylan/chitin deacetylase (PgdA/CDA1 family)